ncbi:MAG: hypothetical protein QHC67_01230 [Sphingobium sp.]|uniref:hypothetical protein n=1 Tax=Sphingobium sp. TaxID=1912891 RepID=UPI0029A1B262|nr:hypothetical protein [Sphingobium sp.]MDX3908430.1 hypothetical protein [Sphingobium sp.]
MSYSPDQLADLIAEMVGKLDTVIDSGLLGATYDIAFRFMSSPDPSEVVDFCVVATAFTLKAGMPGSVGFVHTVPVANYVLTLRVGGSLSPTTGTAVGTVTISPAGVFTFATAGSGDTIIPAGSLIKLVAPATIDVGISGLAFTIKA